jgi:hypothetical protein
MTHSSAVALRFAVATALFWASLTMAVEGRSGPSADPPLPAFQDLTTDDADAAARPVVSTASEEAPARLAVPARPEALGRLEVLGRPEVLARPAVLAPLWVSFAGLQILDIHSTMRAPDFGAREANPLVRGLLASPAAFVASKAAVTTGLIYASERLRRRHPRTAVLMMIGLNSAYAAVVTRNYIAEARAGAR